VKELFKSDSICQSYAQMRKVPVFYSIFDEAIDQHNKPTCYGKQETHAVDDNRHHACSPAVCRRWYRQLELHVLLRV